MTEPESSVDTVRTLNYFESVLFPSGHSRLENEEAYDNHRALLGYISDYPGFDVDITSSLLLGAKLAAVSSVNLDRQDGVPTRPDLARVISDRNYAPDYVLAVSRNALGRMVSRGKERALSVPMIDRYAQEYGADGARRLAADTAKFAMASEHLDIVRRTADLEIDVMDLIRENGLLGAERMAGDRFSPKRMLAGDDNVNIAHLDREILEVIKIINRVGKQALGGRALDAVGGFGKQAELLRDVRIQLPFAKMADSQDSIIVFDGSNADMLRGAVVVPPRREEIAVTGPTAEDVEAIRVRRAAEAAQRSEAQQQERLQQAQAEAERVHSIDRENEPILERIGRLSEEYKQLIDVVYGYSKKLLREKHVFGRDSVVGRMLSVFDATSREMAERAARLYAGLAINASEITTHDELVEWMDKVAHQRALYEAACEELLAGGSAYELPELGTDIARDLLWLDTNFETMYVECIADCRPHVRAVGDESIDRVISLLGRGGESRDTLSETEIEEEPATEASEEAAEKIIYPTLAEVRAKAETVDWTIMPSETVTKEDLREIVCDTLRRKGVSNGSVDEILLDERLGMILDWREAYDAQLYYSSEKMMDESGNFYFVLTFSRDDKNYAIAENPVYGNATYAMAEHLMPLLEGESLLTVVKELRRKSIRSLSGRQIYHREGPISHPEKVETAIKRFSTQSLD